jgi:hypothetical protein
VKKEIGAYFEKVASKFQTVRRQIKDDLDATSSEDLNYLDVLENIMHTHLETMKE